jgi:hypothetical protein
MAKLQARDSDETIRGNRNMMPASDELIQGFLNWRNQAVFITPRQ